MNDEMHKWEEVSPPYRNYDSLTITERMRVPGGWLYNIGITARDTNGVWHTAQSVVFVPDPAYALVSEPAP